MCIITNLSFGLSLSSVSLSPEEVPSLMSAAALTCFYSWSSTLPPPPASLACCHSNTSIRTATTPSSWPTHRPARPSTPSTPRGLSSPQQTLPLLSTSWPALPQQPYTPPGPRSISPTLPSTFAFNPQSLHLVSSVLNLPVVGYTQTITFVACFTAPNQRALGSACSSFAFLASECGRWDRLGKQQWESKVEPSAVT